MPATLLEFIAHNMHDHRIEVTIFDDDHVTFAHQGGDESITLSVGALANIVELVAAFDAATEALAAVADEDISFPDLFADYDAFELVED